MKFSDKFIKANNKLCDFEEFVPAPYFRKEFRLDFKPEKAEITICGLGFYELYINGKEITKGPLAPYISNTDDVCYYDNYDISDMLNEGDNVIGVLLGNGFRNCYGGFMWDFDKAACRGPVTFAFCLKAENGRKVYEIEADESIKTHSSPILYDDLRMGYFYDSRLEIPDWNMVDFDDSNWTYAICENKPRGSMRLCEVEPIVVTKQIEAIEIKHFKKLPFAHDKSDERLVPFEDTYRENVYIYDFGFNTAGVTKLKIKGKPGQKITIRHAEHMVRGNFSVNTTVFQRDNEQNNIRYRQFGQTDTFICKGGEEVFVPKFKYDGFRYAYVEGLEKEQATKDAVVCLVMNSDIQSRGSFGCSDEIINALYKCTQNSVLSNFYYFPTDCPHREKNGWTADAWLSSEHMLLNFTVERSLQEWLFNVRCAQRADGALPGIVPTGGFGFEWGNGPVWDSVCVQIPYYLYKYTGNKEVIKENASMILRYLFYLSSKQDENGLTGFGLGDWCDPFEEENGYIASPIEVTASIASYDIANKAQFLFKQVGLEKERVYAQMLASKLRESIRNKLIDFETMTVKGNCQTSQVLALAMGLFDENELAAARETLVSIIHRDGDINTCGVYGIRYIYHILADMGKAELAHRMITSNQRTGYGYLIENGATTLWESFKIVGSPKENSKNHHFFGDISSWFVQCIAGLKPNPNADDIKYFEISPNFITDINFAKATYDSVFGKVSVEWNRSSDKDIILHVEVPKGTYGKVVLPCEYKLTEDTDLEWNINDKNLQKIFVFRRENTLS